MLAALYSFVNSEMFSGFDLWMLFWILSIAVYFLIFGFINRKNIKPVFVGLLGVELLFDLMCIIIFGMDKMYLKYAVMATYGFFVWDAFLLIAGVSITVYNRCLKRFV